MGTVGRRVQPDCLDPRPDDPRILPRRKMRQLRQTAGKKELLRLQMRRADPSRDRIARLLGDLKLHRPLSLLLHNNRARGYMTALDHVVDAKPDQIAPAQLAVDGEVD